MFFHNNKVVWFCCLLSTILFSQFVHALEQYEILPGDVMQISVWKEEDLMREVLVRPDGGISFPLAGEIPTKGKTPAQVRAEIAKKLEKYIPEPEVNVAVLQTQGNKAYVVGKVARPGAVLMDQDLDVMQALSVAGGTTTFAKLDEIKILRRNSNGTEVAIPFDYTKVQDGEALETNIVLKQGDVVVVP